MPYEPPYLDSCAYQIAMLCTHEARKNAKSFFLVILKLLPFKCSILYFTIVLYNSSSFIILPIYDMPPSFIYAAA